MQKRSRGWRALIGWGWLRRVRRDPAVLLCRSEALGWEMTCSALFCDFLDVTDRKQPICSSSFSWRSDQKGWRPVVSSVPCVFERDVTCGQARWSMAGVGRVFLGPVAEEHGMIWRHIFLWNLLPREREIQKHRPSKKETHWHLQKNHV